MVVTAASEPVCVNCSRGQRSLKKLSSNRQLRDTRGRTAGSVIGRVSQLGVLTGRPVEIQVKASVTFGLSDSLGRIVHLLQY